MKSLVGAKIPTKIAERHTKVIVVTKVKSILMKRHKNNRRDSNHLAKRTEKTEHYEKKNPRKNKILNDFQFKGGSGNVMIAPFAD